MSSSRYDSFRLRHVSDTGRIIDRVLFGRFEDSANESLQPTAKTLFLVLSMLMVVLLNRRSNSIVLIDPKIDSKYGHALTSCERPEDR